MFLFAVTRERVTDIGVLQMLRFEGGFYSLLRESGSLTCPRMRSMGRSGFYSLLREGGSLTVQHGLAGDPARVSIRCYARAGH